MEYFQSAQAGKTEKGDILIVLDPGPDEKGIQILLQCSAEAEFGRQIKKTIHEVLTEYGIRDAVVTVQDQGAMDFVVRARTETVAKRALGVVK